MRLAPIDRPSSLLGRLMSFAMRRQLGKVIMPARVLYNRIPRMWNVSFALVRLEMTGLRIDPELRLLIHVRGSMLNHCTFCTDIAAAQAIQARMGLAKFQALGHWEESDLFSDRERAVLRFVDEMTRERNVGDDTWAGLTKHFEEREAAEVVLVNAVSSFYNLLNLPLGIEEDGLRELAEARVGGARAGARG